MLYCHAALAWCGFINLFCKWTFNLTVGMVSACLFCFLLDIDICLWHCLLVSEGNGNYRTAGSDFLHQLPKEVPQHHLWTPSHRSAAKRKRRNTRAPSGVSVQLAFKHGHPFGTLEHSLCFTNLVTFQNLPMVRYKRNIKTGPEIFCGSLVVTLCLGDVGTARCNQSFKAAS